MKREDLTNLGLTDEQVSSVMDIYGKSVEKLKTDVSTLTTQLNTAKGQLTEANTKLEGFDPEWKAKAEKAQKDADAQVDAMRRSHAIEAAITARKGKNAKAIRALIDEAAVTVNEKGEVIGLSEQLDAVEKENSYLFGTDEQQPHFSRPTPGVSNPTPNKNEQANAALRSLFGRNE